MPYIPVEHLETSDSKDGPWEPAADNCKRYVRIKPAFFATLTDNTPIENTPLADPGTKRPEVLFKLNAKR